MKEAWEIFHVHKEWGAASLPRDPPVIITGDTQCCLSSLGSLDHVKHGLNLSVTSTRGQQQSCFNVVIPAGKGVLP